VADEQALAGSWHDTRLIPVVALRVECCDSGIARPQREPQGNGLSASLHTGLSRGGSSGGRLVRHECAGRARGTTRTGSRRDPVPAAVSAAGFRLPRAAGSSSLRLGASRMVVRQRGGLRHLLLLHLARMSEPAQLRWDCRSPRHRVPCFFSSDRMGADVCGCTRVLHADVLPAP